MKVKMIYNLPEDQEDFLLAANSVRMHSILWDLNQWLRSEIKYKEDVNQSKHDTLQECREKLFELLRDNNIEL